MISRLLRASSLFLFCAVCFINRLENTATSGFTDATDRQVLLAIKDMITRDPFEALSSWNNSLHFCSWQGVACGRQHQRVTALNLSSLQLAGSLAPHVGNLTFIGMIDFSETTFMVQLHKKLVACFAYNFSI